MKIVITGAHGFIGQNLWMHFEERGHVVIPILRENTTQNIDTALSEADVVIHLAGENRPTDEFDFEKVNVGFTEKLCNLILDKPNIKAILFASSTQAVSKSAYGISKRKAEKHIEKLAEKRSIKAGIYRLPNIFGKWSKPNYNSVVATFCYNIVNGLPIEIFERDSKINLLYVDDLANNIVNLVENFNSIGVEFIDVTPNYHVKITELAKKLNSFKQNLHSLRVGNVASGLDRALYATFLSYMQPEQFSQSLKINKDRRGIFAEILKTDSSGQFSFFTLKLDEKRGGHYHHTKNEKFVIIKGAACFNFRNVVTREVFSLDVSEYAPQIVTTVPGWAHEIVNVGCSEVVGIVWANEVFDPHNADTIGAEV